MRTRIKIGLLLLLISASLASMAQNSPVTGMDAVVTDVRTGEPIAFAQAVFVGTNIGVVADMDGHIYLENNQGLVTVSVSFVGYKKQLITLKANQIEREVHIELEPDLYELNEVVISPSQNRERYSRKNNPAVDMVGDVIARKEEMRPAGDYTVQNYEKLIMALDGFDFEFERNKLLENFAFLRKYVDTSQFGQTPVLTVSLREVLTEEHHKGTSVERRELTRRMQGVDKVLEKEGLASNLDAMFSRIDIFANTVEVMVNRFVSPLSSTLAISYYHYYITDTIDVDGERCVELMFVPVNKESFGFMGHLYITVDGHYLKRYAVSVPPQINMNFVSDLSIEETFRRQSSGRLVSDEVNTYAKFYIFKNMRQLYAHHTVYAYEGGPEADSLAGRTFSKEQWNQLRPVPLNGKESVIDSLVTELKRVPAFNVVVKAVEIIVSGYVSTSADRSKSLFDIGPVYNFISLNPQEGVRLRVGGMTTANLSDHWFMNGYMAFGTSDLRLKYNATAIYSFRPKEHHPFESLRHALYFSTMYDLENPGQSTDLLDRDNILMSRWPTSEPTAMQYVRRTQLRYEHEWENRVSIDAWVQYADCEPAGSLSYNRITADGTTQAVKQFSDWQAGLQLRYAPGEPLYNNRLGKESPFNLSKDAPIFRLRHTVGLMDGSFGYQRTDIIAEKRIWLSSFGHIDARLHTGVLWNRVPLPGLFTPQSNYSIYLSPNTFTLMRPMEFVADQWLAIYATYYLKGWIFNRIPLVKKLKLREVVSFSGIYGSLSPKNNPRFGCAGLYTLPDGCEPFGDTPYAEISFGVENILHCIRIDYVRRISYTEGQSASSLNGIRIGFRLTI